MLKSREQDLAPGDIKKRSWDLGKATVGLAKLGAAGVILVPGVAAATPNVAIMPIAGSERAPSGSSTTSIGAGEATSVSINNIDSKIVKKDLIEELCDIAAGQADSIPEGSDAFVQVMGSPDTLVRSKEADKKLFKPTSLTRFALGAVKKCLVNEKGISTGVKFKAVPNFGTPLREDADARGALRFQIATDLGEKLNKIPTDRQVTNQTSRVLNAFDRGTLKTAFPQYSNDMISIQKDLSGTTLNSYVVSSSEK